MSALLVMLAGMSNPMQSAGNSAMYAALKEPLVAAAIVYSIDVPFYGFALKPAM